MPPGKGYIIASKHQSAWETFAILLFLNDPSYILKRELMFIPVFGWYAAKARVVAVHRGKRSKALMDMNRQAAAQIEDGREIVIFPEGTRTAPFAPPKYKYGVAHMYDQIECTVLPVALNSGLYWPRQSFMRYPGTIVLEFLPPIEPGLGVEKFRQTLESSIETATNQILAEDSARENPPPLAAYFKSKFANSGAEDQ